MTSDVLFADSERYEDRCGYIQDELDCEDRLRVWRSVPRNHIGSIAIKRTERVRHPRNHIRQCLGEMAKNINSLFRPEDVEPPLPRPYIEPTALEGYKYDRQMNMLQSIAEMAAEDVALLIQS